MLDIPRISKLQFAAWKNNPVTLTVFKYLEVYSTAQKTAHLDRWISGEAVTDSDFEVKARGVILFLQEFSLLEYEEMAQTFGWLEEEDDGGEQK
jgi:hypothetical protein